MIENVTERWHHNWAYTSGSNTNCRGLTQPDVGSAVAAGDLVFGCTGPVRHEPFLDLLLREAKDFSIGKVQLIL